MPILSVGEYYSSLADEPPNSFSLEYVDNFMRRQSSLIKRIFLSETRQVLARSLSRCCVFGPWNKMTVWEMGVCTKRRDLRTWILYRRQWSDPAHLFQQSPLMDSIMAGPNTWDTFGGILEGL